MTDKFQERMNALLKQGIYQKISNDEIEKATLVNPENKYIHFNSPEEAKQFYSDIESQKKRNRKS